MNYESDQTWLGGARAFGPGGLGHGCGRRPRDAVGTRPAYSTVVEATDAIDTAPPYLMGVTPSGSRIRLKSMNSQAMKAPRADAGPGRSVSKRRLQREKCADWVEGLPSHFGPSSTGM